MISTVGALALAVVGAGCASTGSVRSAPVPKPFPMPRPSPAAMEPDPGVPAAGGAVAAPEEAVETPTEAPRPAGLDTYALVGTALELRGVPYRDGGVDPRGFDCSGFTQYVYRQHGLTLPRAVRDQFSEGIAVSLSELAPGDLLFFSTTESGASHVGIAVGTDQFVHAPSSTGVVRVERLSSSYWARRFIGARRPTPP